MINRYNDKARVLKIEKNLKLIPGHIISKHSSAREQRKDSNGIPVATEETSIIIRASERENPYRLLKKWMTKETRDLIEETIVKFSSQITETPVRVSVTDTQRWGYCRTNRSIVFNWQLIALPNRLAEFVILHEYVHVSSLHHARTQ